MSLRENLVKPLVIKPGGPHTHTVVFLHRFPAETSDEELLTKVLSSKLTKNHKTLQEQFPAVRWVFPYPKLHPAASTPTQHWSNLSAADKTELELDGTAVPYITQIILQEAKRIGLDKVILGGQGETAVAAHDAMAALPEVDRALRDGEPDQTQALARALLRSPSPTARQPRLAGFVGMHGQDGKATADARSFGLASRLADGQRVGDAIVRNTPHEFIRGGYKVQTTTWDGRRIDDFASFLARAGVSRRAEAEAVSAAGDAELLTPAKRKASGGQAPAEDTTGPRLTPQQKHLEEVMRQKREDELTRRRVLVRIEHDKLERKRRQERERQARVYAAAKKTDSGGAELSSSNHVDEFGSEESCPEDSESPMAEVGDGKPLRKRRDQWGTAYKGWEARPAGADSTWAPQSQEGMSENQMRALGLTVPGGEKKEDGI